LTINEIEVFCGAGIERLARPCALLAEGIAVSPYAACDRLVMQSRYNWSMP
jgi:hypothetical protein